LPVPAHAKTHTSHLEKNGEYMSSAQTSLLAPGEDGTSGA